VGGHCRSGSCPSYPWGANIYHLDTTASPVRYAASICRSSPNGHVDIGPTDNGRVKRIRRGHCGGGTLEDDRSATQGPARSRRGHLERKSAPGPRSEKVRLGDLDGVCATVHHKVIIPGGGRRPGQLAPHLSAGRKPFRKVPVVKFEMRAAYIGDIRKKSKSACGERHSRPCLPSSGARHTHTPPKKKTTTTTTSKVAIRYSSSVHNLSQKRDFREGPSITSTGSRGGLPSAPAHKNQWRGR